MKNTLTPFRIAAVLLVVLIVGALGAGTALAQEYEGPMTDSGILLFAPFSSIQVDRGQTFTIDVFVANGETTDQVIDLSISGPQDWKPRLMLPGLYIVRQVHLPAREGTGLRLVANVPADAAGGDYEFLVEGSADGGRLTSSITAVVGVAEKSGVGAVSLSTQYPDASGRPGDTLGFKVELVNQGDEDLTLSLAADAPQYWEVSFQPSFERKKITAISLEAGATRSLDIEVKPPDTVAPGAYEITVVASAGTVQAGVNLTANMKGTYQLLMGTAEDITSGRLNTEATAGRETILSLFLVNSGTAPVEGISFLSTKPSGWSVNFAPDKMAALDPASPVQQVDVTIKPAANAIAGDYMVTLTASGAQVAKSVQVRVSVGTATAWGWIGMGLVLVVVVGLVGVFWQLGRR